MGERELLARITANPKIFGGRPIVRGHRLSVAQVLAMLADGATPEKLVATYEWLEPDDISACLLYAARRVARRDRDRARRRASLISAKLIAQPRIRVRRD